MGQYYKIVNTTKKQYLHPHEFDNGLKLLEFGCSALGAMTGLAILLADGNGRGGGDIRSRDPIVGSWAGNTIVIAGDYADEGSFVSDEDVKAFCEARRKELDKEDPSEREKMLRYIEEFESGEKKPTLYAVAEYAYENISGKVINALCDDSYICKDFAESWVGGSFGPFEEVVEHTNGLKAKLQAAVEKHGITKEKLDEERKRRAAAMRPDMVLVGGS